jgi:hypothetical protein
MPSLVSPKKMEQRVRPERSSRLSTEWNYATEPVRDRDYNFYILYTSLYDLRLANGWYAS